MIDLQRRCSGLVSIQRILKEILVTHQDTDHVGAIEQGSDELFRDATIYIGNIENEYLEGRKHRKVFWGLTTLPQVIIDNPKILIEDGQIFYIGNIKIEAFLVPGHTWGHLVYLVDDCYLFTGDTIWLGADWRLRILKYTCGRS